MALLGWFDGELRPDGWFDDELQPVGWFGVELINTSAGGGGGVVNYTLTGTVGSYALSGQSATFKVAHILSGGQGDLSTCRTNSYL